MTQLKSNISNKNLSEIEIELKNLQLDLFFYNLKKKKNIKSHIIRNTKQRIAQLLLKKSFLVKLKK